MRKPTQKGAVKTSGKPAYKRSAETKTKTTRKPAQKGAVQTSGKPAYKPRKNKTKQTADNDECGYCGYVYACPDDPLLDDDWSFVTKRLWPRRQRNLYRGLGSPLSYLLHGDLYDYLKNNESP